MAFSCLRWGELQDEWVGSRGKKSVPWSWHAEFEMTVRHPDGNGTGDWTSLELGVVWAGDEMWESSALKKGHSY